MTGAKTLILHWNGVKWSQVTNLSPVYGALYAVTAVSADNAWAVGEATNSQGQDSMPLVMHWNGKKWARAAGVPKMEGQLFAVAVSGDSVWAVGDAGDGTYLPALILHLTGNRWYLVPVQTPRISYLYGAAATGNGTAWISGQSFTSPNANTYSILMRWNGQEWKSVSSPLQGASKIINALSAGPAGALWAAGASITSKNGINTYSATTMLWNGKTWRTVPVPDPADNGLAAVGFVPGGTAWAVGNTESEAVLILRWTGRAWTQVIYRGAPGGMLSAVAATSPSNAWAVGSESPGELPETLILHWNGTTWS